MAESRADVLLHRTGIACALLFPLGVLHAFALAEATMAIAGLCFLARRIRARDASFLATPWLRIGLVWWAWVILCSIPFPGRPHAAWGGLGQALMVGRYLVFAAALEHDLLRDPAPRRWLQHVLTACALWIAAQSLLQVVTGRNLAGYHRWGDGEITGPFLKPRAGAPYSRLLPPVLLPPVARLLDRGGAWSMLAAFALAAGGLAVSVLIGQRMPVLLSVFGLALAALLLPRLRGVVIAATAAGALLLAASAAVVPPTFYRLVTKFSAQMENFPQSPYGLLAARAIAIGRAHPVIGLGYSGFRRACDDPAYFQGWHHDTDPKDDGGGIEGCNLHPHNHYLQALTDSGVPGLILFSALVLAWLQPLARGLWRTPDPLRVGLFCTALVSQWPLASTENAFAVDLAGWFIIMLGLGLAEARWRGHQPPASVR